MTGDVIVARTVDDVLSAWDTHPAACVLAGGTDILVRLKDVDERPPLIDISRIASLHGVEVGDDTVRIGALATYTDILETTLPRELASVRDAAYLVGSPQIRNRGSVGGNIMNASPAGDLIPPLVAADAVVTYISRETGGAHADIPLADLFVGPGHVAVPAATLLTGIVVPRRPGWRSAFVRLGQREALAISKVSVALAVHLSDGRIVDARVALGAVAPRVIRATETEKLVRDRPPDDLPADTIRATLMREAQPISDIRSSDAYRREMTATLFSRAAARVRQRCGAEE